MEDGAKGIEDTRAAGIDEPNPRLKGSSRAWIVL